MKSIFACAAALCATSASAATFDLKYEATGGVLSAVIEGTLLADMNTVVVTGIKDFATFDGVAGPSLPNIGSADNLLIETGFIDPKLTLDGSYLDFFAGDADLSEGFTFNVANFLSLAAGDSFTSSPGFGNADFELFDVATYSLTEQVAPIPLPTSAALLLCGIGAVAAFRRRRT